MMKPSLVISDALNPFISLTAFPRLLYPLRILLTLVALSLPALPAGAWNAVGHWAVAELVWRQMGPADRQAASALLQQHPHYQQLLAANRPAGVAADEWAFLNAAVWPDRVRPAQRGQPRKPHSVTKYNLYPHGIEWPFVQASDVGEVSLEEFPVAEPIVQAALSNSIATLKNRRAIAHDRTVGLCWALHLCADLHQPLHVATLVTQDKPRGHAAGGELVVLDRHGARIDLHAFWDRLPGLDYSYQAVATLANELAAEPELQPARLKEYQEHKTIVSWMQESFELAVEFAYAEDRIQFVDAADVRSGKIAASAIPVLRDDYVREAQEIARRRLALAALRLTDELRPVWRTPPAPKPL